MNQNSIKTIIFASMLLCSALHAMHDAKTEADRAAVLKAKAQLEKIAIDEEDMLGALGNTNGISLINEVAKDREKYEAHKKKKEDAAKMPERKAALIAWQKECSKSGKSVGFARFFDLPYPIQAIILSNYFRDETALYALRHKRVLAPCILSKHLGKADWTTVLAFFDRDLQDVKGFTNQHIKINGLVFQHPQIYCHVSSLKGEYAVLKKYKIWRGDWNCAEYFNAETSKQALDQGPGSLSICGYSDRTYDFLLNAQDFKEFVNRYSMEQLEFLVLLTRLPCLSEQDRAMYQTFDQEMQNFIISLVDFREHEIGDAKTEREYKTIIESKAEFEKTQSDMPIMSIDDNIEQAQNELCAHVSALMHWVASKMQAWYKK